MEPTPRPSPPPPPEASAGLTRLVRAASGGMVVLTFLACTFVTAGTLSGRWSLLSVPTGSMEPAIPAGAGVVVVPTDVEEVVEGDVIVFSAPETDTPTVHRVAQVDVVDGSTVFRTKGDANPVQDPWALKIDEEHVGRVVSVSPSLGVFTQFAGERVVRLGAAGLGAVMVLFAGLRSIWGNNGSEGDRSDDVPDEPADDSDRSPASDRVSG